LIFEASVPTVEKGNRRRKKVLLSFLVVHFTVSKIHLLTGSGGHLEGTSVNIPCHYTSKANGTGFGKIQVFQT